MIKINIFLKKLREGAYGFRVPNPPLTEISKKEWVRRIQRNEDLMVFINKGSFCMGYSWEETREYIKDLVMGEIEKIREEYQESKFFLSQKELREAERFLMEVQDED